MLEEAVEVAIAWRKTAVRSAEGSGCWQVNARETLDDLKVPFNRRPPVAALTEMDDCPFMTEGR